MELKVLPPEKLKDKAKKKVKEWKAEEQRKALQAKLGRKKPEPSLKGTEPHPRPEKKKSESDKMLLDSIEKGDLEEAKKAIESSADVNACDHFGNAPLILACYHGDGGYMTYIDNSSLIQPIRNTWAGLNAAERADRKGIARLLIEAKADLNYSNRCGETALMVAAFHGNVEYVRMLLSENADPNARDKEGFTALGYVLESRSKTAIKESFDILEEMLRKHGAEE